jgi:hypothetical protein
LIPAALCVFLSTATLVKAVDPGRVSGLVTDPDGASVAGVKLSLTRANGTSRETQSDGQGTFAFDGLEPGDYSLTAEGSGFAPVRKAVSVAAGTTLTANLQIMQLASQKSVVIVSSTLEPSIDRRNTEVYSKTLFERDDQLLETLDAGINAGQHEGGGKSLEIRRFGFNLDHGGVNGGLKIVVNDLPQNQASQGHGQGYLGALKALTPELVQEVSILNGPFSPEYGDFSGLGVVQIRTRDSLPDQLTARFQGGSFDTYRTFLAFSLNSEVGPRSYPAE